MKGERRGSYKGPCQGWSPEVEDAVPQVDLFLQRGRAVDADGACMNLTKHLEALIDREGGGGIDKVGVKRMGCNGCRVV